MSRETILSKYPDYESNIGIEVHVQLNTKSKIFCSCPNKISKEPNKNICPICTGYPGVLPVLNKEVVNGAIMAGLATHCKIAQISNFARKHYFYPDLPKGYQITQHTEPICEEGFVPIRLEDGSTKKIRLIRIHIEEDAGKNIHSGKESFVDLNRAGTPLLEIVTYPDMTNSNEVRAYLKALHSIVQYLGISSGNMEDGAFRADTNISIRKRGAKELGTRCELKNINSFKFISDAVEYEIERQINLVEDGEKVIQQTRLWDTKNKKTVPMRSKEEAADYRYFQDPDLPLVEVNEEWITRVQKLLPELPWQKFDRLVKANGLSQYEADILVGDIQLSKYFEEAYKHHPSKLTINWVLRDIMGLVKEEKIPLRTCKVTPRRLAALVKMLDDGKINSRSAQDVFKIVAQSGQEPAAVVKEKGLGQVGSEKELEAIVLKLLNSNKGQVEAYRNGNERLFGFFMGQAMQKTQGRGNPKLIQEILKKHLAG